MNSDKVLKKIQQMREQAPGRVLNYVADLPPDMRVLVLPYLPEAERNVVMRRVKGRQWRRNTVQAVERATAEREHIASAAKRKKQERKTLAEFGAFVQALRTSRSNGEDVATLAAQYTQYTQKQLAPFLLAKEKEQLRKIRASFITRSKVQTVLECTPAEFERWVTDERLPEFSRKLIHGIQMRVFLRSEIEAAKGKIDEWRKKDSIVKTARRTKPRIVR